MSALGDKSRRQQAHRAIKKARSNLWTGPQVARKDQVIPTRFVWWLAAWATRRRPKWRHLGWYRHNSNSLDHLLSTKISPVQPYAVERLTAGP